VHLFSSRWSNESKRESKMYPTRSYK